MPSPPLTNNFDGGVDGATIATSDTGSGNQWSAITSTPTYDNDHAHGGTLSGAAIQTGVYARKSCEWTGLGSLTSDVYFRVYLWIDATATQVFSPLQVRGSSGACAQVVMKTNTFLQSLDAAAGAITPEGTVPYATGQWIRLEWRVKASTTVGETEIRWYLGDSTTAQEILASAASQVLAANVDQVRFGMTGTTGPAAQTIWFDDAAVSTAGWIGPSVGAGRIFRRFYGPAQLGASAATLYTSPAGVRSVMRRIWVNNPSGAPVDFTFSIGADAAATRRWDSYNIPAGEALEWAYDEALEPGETIQAFAGSAATLVAVVDGYQESL